MLKQRGFPRRWVPILCIQCEQFFEVKKSRAARGARFCSAACRGQYDTIQRRWYNILTLPDRFAEQVDQTPTERGCLLWTGSIEPVGGYGLMHVGDGRESAMAHRVAWEIAHGKIDDGLFVLHRCDNPPCVNVDHLFLGTHQDNMDDMVRKGRSMRGKPRKRFTVDDIRTIRSRFFNGTSREQLAKDFNVHLRAIRDIVNRKRWANVLVC